MQFILGDFGGTGMMSKDLYASFRCTNHTHSSCVKDVSPAQTLPHLPTTKKFSLETEPEQGELETLGAPEKEVAAAGALWSCRDL